tara:strand:+ start:8437 stop:8946 length:510 start_codon:yes stop_codon:yes gene_type:complete
MSLQEGLSRHEGSKEFNYKLFRYSSEMQSTLGLLMAAPSPSNLYFRCYTMEDEHRDIKVLGKTRIRAGRFEIKKRHGSPKFSHLDDKYSWHSGMLWLQDVPNFTWVYIHTGNKHEHTDACILIGDGAQSNIPDDGAVTNSRQAYERFYKEVSLKISLGIRVFIQIEDLA